MGGGLGAGVRGAGLALLCALLTATAHAAGGGSLPDLALLVVLLPLLGGVLTHLARRTTGTAGLVAVLGGGQLALHLLLELLHPGHPGPPAAAAMLATHVGATLVLALAVRRADAGLAAVAAALRRVLPRRPVPPPLGRPRATVVAAPPAAVPRPAAGLCSAGSRRGPPARC